MQNHASTLAAEFKLDAARVAATVALIDEGNTIPFIARYRKEATGGLDDATLRDLDERLTYLRTLEARKADVLRTIDELGSTPTRTAYVGDSPGDVKVAQNAGAFAIGVSWGYHHADELRAAQANVVIDSPEELLRFASERS